MIWSWRYTELVTTVTGLEPIRLPCLELHENYGVSTYGEHERRTAPANSERYKKHQQRCSSSLSLQVLWSNESENVFKQMKDTLNNFVEC